MENPYRAVAVVQALAGAAVVAAILSRIVLFPDTAVPTGPAATLVAGGILAALAWGVLAFWNTRYLLRGTGRRGAIWVWGVVALLFPVGTLLAIFPLWVLVRNLEPDAPTKA